MIAMSVKSRVGKVARSRSSRLEWLRFWLWESELRAGLLPAVSVPRLPWLVTGRGRGKDVSVAAKGLTRLRLGPVEFGG